MRIKKAALDKDLKKLQRLEDSTRAQSLGFLAPGIAFVFLALSALFASLQAGAETNTAILVAAAILAGYMALNIGANDVANNVGPAVGARAITMFGAIIVAAIFESAGALLAGGDVVKTISKGIIAPDAVADGQQFIIIMMAALCSAAVWVNLATYIGAPVSTTHAVVGGVVGAGVAAVGAGLINWPIMMAIAASVAQAMELTSVCHTTAATISPVFSVDETIVMMANARASSRIRSNAETNCSKVPSSTPQNNAGRMQPR